MPACLPSGRTLALVAIAATATACSGVGYKDSNAAVDANPLCVSAPDRPGDPVSKDCERTREATWSSEGGRDADGKPIDFGGKHD